MHAPLSPAYRAEWRPLGELAAITDEWRALAAATIEPNVFYEPSFALAAARVFGHDAGATLVWNELGRLVGLFPARVERWRGGFWPVLTGWTHPYGPLGTPLVDAAHAEGAIAAWLAFLRREHSLPPLLLLPLLPEHGRFAAALDRALERSATRSIGFNRHQRALLEPGTHRQDYVEHAISTARRKELRRQRRRLEEFAPVTFATASSPAEIGSALQDFLLLEASGWKGLAGTAAVNAPDVRRFIESAVPALAAEGKASIHRLMLKNRAIAVAITLASGDTAWCWKIAYNEGVSRASPGVQLLIEVTDRLLADPAMVHADSCAVPNHPMVDHVWRERLTLGDRLIATRSSALPLALAYGAESVRRGAMALAKSVRDGMRPRPRRKPAPAPAAVNRAAGASIEPDLARLLARR